MSPLLKQAVLAIAGPLARGFSRLRIRLALPAAAPAAQRLLQVIDRVLADDFPAGDRQWFARIEALRGELSASTRPIALVDFGAGGPNDRRSAEEMRRGIRVDSTVGAVCRLASKPPFWARLLFAVVREYEPQRGVELGTCLGLSAAYQGAAMQLAGNGGTLRTLEGADSLAEKSRENLAALRLDNVAVVAGRFEQTLGNVLQEAGRIDYAFVDGHHDEQATIAYFRQLLPYLAPGAVLVFDDISWSPGMARAWQVISADPRVRVAVDLRAVGVCVLGDQAQPRATFRYYLP